MQGKWECPNCGTRHYNVEYDKMPKGSTFIMCSNCKVKTPVRDVPELQKPKKGIPMITRSTMHISDPKRDIKITITLDDKGFAGENAGALCRLTNDLNDTLRKYANAHEIKVVEFAKVLKSDKKVKKSKNDSVGR